MTPWKYADAAQTIVFRTLDDVSCESCLASREDVQAWVKEGNVIVPPDVSPPSMVVSKIDFLQRMTLEERIAARAAAQTDPIVADLFHLLAEADEVHLDHKATRQGVGYFEQIGIVAKGRAAEILDPTFALDTGVALAPTTTVIAP